MANDGGAPQLVRAAAAIPLPRVPAIVAMSGGRLCALPTEAVIYVDTPMGVGSMRYLSADGALFVHFDQEPLESVHEIPRASCRPVTGGLSLLALEALLARNPEPTCDLDEDTTVDEHPAGAA